MVMSRRAQIFLLAAVIISAIVLSLGITANQARITDESKKFYDYSYEVKKEVGAVIDYEIYTNFSEGDDLDDFVDILSENIQDSEPDATFMFIYGNDEELTLKTHKSKKERDKSTIAIGDFYKEIEEDGDYTEILDKEDLEGAKEINIEFEDSEVTVKLSKHRQVIFIIKKDKNDESFVAKG